MRTEYGKASVVSLTQMASATKAAGKMALNMAEEPFSRIKALSKDTGTWESFRRSWLPEYFFNLLLELLPNRALDTRKSLFLFS